MEWACTIGGWLLIAVAAALLAWGLFADRARGRRRCPKCWYDMAGVAGLKCPECGNAAASERAFSRCRRRWRIVIAAMPVLAAGLFLRAWPEVSRQGWTGFIPSTILVVAAPAESETQSMVMLGGLPMTTATTTGEDLTNCAWKRMGQGKMWGWQSSLFIGRWMRKQGCSLGEAVKAPDHWMENRSVPVRVFPPWRRGTSAQVWIDGPGEGPGWGSSVVWRPGVATGQRLQATVVVGLGSRELYRERVTLGTAFVSDPDLLIKPVRDPEVDAVVARALRPRLLIEDDEVHVIVSDHTDDAAWKQLSVGVGFEVSVVADGAVIGVGKGGTNWDYPVWKAWIDVPMQWRPGGMARVRADPSTASFSVKGDIGGPLESYLERSYTRIKPTYWAGRFVAPARIVKTIESE